MRELGNKVTIMAQGVITGKELTWDGYVKYQITTSDNHLCYVYDKSIIREEIKEAKLNVYN